VKARAFGMTPSRTLATRDRVTFVRHGVGQLDGKGCIPRIIEFYAMNPGRSAYALAVLGLVCVLSIFFFPGVTGPYSVVHGPVTALLSMRMASRMRMAIARAGLNVLRNGRFLAASALAMLWIAVPGLESPALSLSARCSAVLRC